MQLDTIFETERLILRPIRVEDAEAFHAFTSDPIALEFLNTEPLSFEATRAGLRKNVEIRASKILPLGFRAVVHKQTCEVLGNCGLSVLSDVEHNPVEISYHFIRKHWNQGYATEAAHCLFSHGLIDMQLPEIVAAINPKNIASARVAQKLGMTPCRKIDWPEQGTIDLYAITKEHHEHLCQQGRPIR